ncbi:MAG: AcvB/VirJ family lysyl-phosphatidylglycerol hydrolase [Vicinamibacterales bacterium]
MRSSLGGFIAVCLLALSLRAAGPSPAPAPAPQTLTVPTFGEVTLYKPARPAEQVVLFISGDGGWNLGVVSMAERLRDQGALVVGIDVRRFIRSLDASPTCAYPAGSLEDLSKAVQLHERLPRYIRPMLVGYSSGATLVYAALAAAPPESFAGAISLGFCPDLEIRTPLCLMRGLRATPRARGVGSDLMPYPGLQVPWMVLQGEQDQVCAPAATRAFVARTGQARLFSLPKVGHGFGVPRNWDPEFIEAYRAIGAARGLAEAPRRASAPGTSAPTEVSDLDLVELPVPPGVAGDTMAVVLSGDGGWAEIDKAVAAGLESAGIPVVGWSSLDYYWTPRTPDAAATDLARVIEHYSSAWRRPRVILVGYSFGADVLPFLINRLPVTTRARVSRVGLLGLSDTAAFTFHVSSWLGGGGDPAHATAPEVRRLRAPVVCIYGSDESDSPCTALTSATVTAVSVGRGHHFSGEYDRVVRAILGERR